MEPDDLKNIWSEIEMTELSLVFVSVGATSQDLGCLVKWRLPLVDELDFEELALNMESLYAKLPIKKVDHFSFPRLRACEAQTAACQVPEGKASLICFVLARYAACGWGP